MPRETHNFEVEDLDGEEDDTDNEARYSNDLPAIAEYEEDQQTGSARSKMNIHI